MSIPKEPRQLMINLMYLVLTAMLALNVSAEIINAFFDLNDSLKKSEQIASEGANKTKEGIQGVLDKKPELREPLNTGIDKSKAAVDAFVDYVEGIKNNLIDAGGNKNGGVDDGDYIESHGHKVPAGKKNKDITTDILVSKGKGDEIAVKVGELRTQLIQIYREAISHPAVMKEQRLDPTKIDAKVKEYEAALNLEIEKDWQEKAEGHKASWADYKFRQMPLAAVLPILTKLQTDARNGQADATNKLAALVGSFEIKLNQFFPVISAKKGYVIKGEPFEAEVAIGAFSDKFASGATISVNGQSIKLDATGKGKYVVTPSSLGKQNLNLVANVVNPITGEKMSGTSTFEYEVGQRSAVCAADKMNVFYIGVDNPVSVSVAGASSNQINVSASGCQISGSGGKYIVKASAVGPAKINVSAPGITQAFDFRVKRIPDPVAKLGNESSGAMGSGEMKAQRGVLSVLENFDFDAKCTIESFGVARVPKRSDPILARNEGASFNGNARSIVDAATPGDLYYFDEIKVRCPGDGAARKINSMNWRIK